MTTLRCSSIQASIWKNEGEKGPFYNVTMARSYKGAGQMAPGVRDCLQSLNGWWRLCGNLSLQHSASDTPRDAGLLFHCTQHPLANTYKILYGFTCPL